MSKGYFDGEEVKNRNILIQILKAVVSGVLFITSIRIEKNMTGGYRLTAFLRDRS